MFGHGRTWSAFTIGLILAAQWCGGPLDAAGPRILELSGVATAATPIQDDANLYDVQFVGTKSGWAVGDHGVIWHTTDGGRNWRLVNSSVECPLRSVCFLTDRMGWIVGGGTTPYTRIGYGVVLFTSNGGASWQRLAQHALPQLLFVKFFDRQQGIAVGEATSEHPTGVLTTNDGGKTWQPAVGNRHSGWRAADFLGPEVGVVAGARGRVLLFGSGRLLEPRIGQLGLRGLHGVKLQRDETGWLVGDGGLVRRTDTGGVVWKAPPTPLPKELREIFDFRTVESRGQKAWVAGHPGSVIWHTPDSGQTWRQQMTGQSLPINSLTFVSESVGCAVGALGTFLRTDNGGQTWKTVRGRGRRVALMTIHARPNRVSFHLIAKQSGNLGYRSLVLLPARRDIGPDGHTALDQDLRLQEAVAAVGGSAGEIGWQFPISVPGLDRNADKLLADWQRRTEGRFREVFLGKLVCQLRTWRPSVVVIDRAPADDATTALLNEAVFQAVKQSADPTHFIPHYELAALQPWQVEKIYMRLPPGSTGNAHVDLQRYMPRLGSSVQVAAAESYAMWTSLPQAFTNREAYRSIVDKIETDKLGTTPREFFVGIPLMPGSAARRKLTVVDDRENKARRKIAQRQRNYQAYVAKFLNEPRHAGQVIAQLSDIIGGMPDRQAAVQLVQLANEYRRRGHWDLVEATLVELVQRYPDQPAALDAMRWLFQLWTGAEPAWQRAREVQVGQSLSVVSEDAVRARLEKSIHLAKFGPGNFEEDPRDVGLDPLKLVNNSSELKIGVNQHWRTTAVQNWHEQAVRMASLIRKKSPALYRTPEIQFPLAALMRQRGAHRLADGFYRRYQSTADGDLWKRTARSEMWLINPINFPPKKTVSCKKTAEPPYLDGLLSDVCWQNAEEIPLRAAENDELSEGAYPLVMLSYDADYLYIAASIPRVPGTPTDKPTLPGRTYDADLSKFDRLQLFLDVDRDYVTHYEFAVDQRGWTSDACWGNTSWNPRWHVATDADEARWRVEIAIPMTELVPRAPQRKSLWAVGIVRVIPTVGLQSWTHPAATHPRPESFGWVRFD